MAKRPDLLLLDEPVANLDPLARQRLLKALMGTVADRGTTVFLSSHIISELEPLCDYLIVLSASRVQVAGTMSDLLASHRLLVGPRPGDPPAGVEVIATTQTIRQTTYLVRGAPSTLDSDWQNLQPDLEGIVIGYLTNAEANAASGFPIDTSSDVEGGPA
jgi:ABC-2 type transport system ATP-binding protein